METPTVQDEQPQNTKSNIDEAVEAAVAELWREQRYIPYIKQIKAEVEIYEKRKLPYIILPILGGMLAGALIFLALLEPV